MPALAFPLVGGCLCGAVRYEATGGWKGCGHCHCRMCQKAGGAPVVTWFSVTSAHFHITKGALKFRTSSQHAERGFCPDCGSQIIFRYFNDPEDGIDITAATLDNPDSVVPEDQVYTNTRLDFMHGFDAMLPTRKGKLED